MRSRRMLLGLLVAVVLVLAMAVPASAASQFTDIDGSPYEAAIDNLASMQVVGGYADGTFRPDNPLQRQQFAKMAVLTLGYPVTAADVSTFTDTPAASTRNNPLYPGSYVAVAATNHIILGYPDNTFGFYDNVTRQQVDHHRRAGRRSRAGRRLRPDYAGRARLLRSRSTAQNIKKAEYNGLLAGIVDLASWDTAANATRGEAAQLLNNLLTDDVRPPGHRAHGHPPVHHGALQAMPSTEGYGGTKNRLGTIVGPDQYEGVSASSLVSGVGGIPEGYLVKVIASDGYAVSFTRDQVMNATFPMFDPATGNPITTITGNLQMIVAYAMDGMPLGSDVGPLRIALVSPAAEQVTGSSSWAKWVVRIEVTPPPAPTVTDVDPKPAPRPAATRSRSPARTSPGRPPSTSAPPRSPAASPSIRRPRSPWPVLPRGLTSSMSRSPPSVARAPPGWPTSTPTTRCRS